MVAARVPPVRRGAADDVEDVLLDPDTAMASNNEHLLQETLRRLEKGGEVLVMTKVWYTHLGYGRTKIAVEESLRNLGSGTRVAMLLHWPRCRDDVEWMRCSEEEEDVELRYKRAGPAPHLDREDAWVGSWRALEEFYKQGRLAAIGVSNFDAADLSRLLRTCDVKPHVLQGNVWSALFDPQLMTLVQDHAIRFVAYNVMNGVVARGAAAPSAFAKLSDLAARRGADVAQLVLKALHQRGIATIPRASTDAHLAANAPRRVLAETPGLDPLDIGSAEKYMRALLSGNDVDGPNKQDAAATTPVVATFRNSVDKDAVQVFWQNDQTGEKVPVTSDIRPGEAERLQTHPGHTFLAYQGATFLKSFTVTAPRGGWQEFEL